jgi:hypothetical protein
MASISLTDEQRRLIEAFADVYRAVMDEDADTETCFDVLFERGYETALNDILKNQDQATLLKSIHLLAAKHPEAVCRHIADMVGLGDDMHRQQNKPPRHIGFSG